MVFVRIGWTPPSFHGTGIGNGLPFDKPPKRLYKNYMKTLTITDAKKNLGQWLTAAARGEDVGIISGADIIALRKVEVESNDYAFREYGATPKELEAFERAAEKRYRQSKRAGKLATKTPQDLRKMIEEATRD